RRVLFRSFVRDEEVVGPTPATPTSSKALSAPRAGPSSWSRSEPYAPAPARGGPGPAPTGFPAAGPARRVRSPGDGRPPASPIDSAPGRRAVRQERCSRLPDLPVSRRGRPVPYPYEG